ncbi:hypothetical protein GF357_00475 [Candidatus Dojkabacteria bacterium]|nr:hypothetical protein [Candidatus Dojkabacteria bacterium]
MARRKYVQIENKNALLELLREGRKFQRIFVAHNAFKDPKTKEILDEAHKADVPINKVARRDLDRRSRTAARESVIGLMLPQNQWNLDDLLEKLYSKKEDPFFLIFDHVRYSLNIGAIMRTAFGGFVNGVITHIKKASFLTDEALRISMGACERIPVVEMNLFSAIKELQDNAIKVIGLETGGEPYFNVDLTGPVAIVLGAEDVGISPRVLERVDEVATIPMREGIGSLNVNASASIMIYEKVRQEAVAMGNS